MALSPKISICIKDNCRQLVFTDTTATYNASTNTGGWGTPNLELADVTSATISVTIPEHSVVEVNVTDTVVGATIIDGIFELDTLTMENNFDSAEDTAFPDGIYEVTYTIAIS